MYQRTNQAAIMAVVLATVMLSGCAKPWNTANTALEATAMAVVQTDELVAENMGDDHEEARQSVVEQAREALAAWEACEAQEEPPEPCGDRPTVEQFMERYRADNRVEVWEAVTLALEELREALIVAQAAIGIWRDTQEEPGNWSTICDGLHTTQGAVVRAIEAASVDVPPQYETGLSYLGSVCTLVVTAVAGD